MPVAVASTQPGPSGFISEMTPCILRVAPGHPGFTPELAQIFILRTFVQRGLASSPAANPSVCLHIDGDLPFGGADCPFPETT